MSRRQAREVAMQILFGIDFSKTEIDRAFEYAVTEFKVPTKEQRFTRELLEGTLKHQSQLDTVIESLSRNWDLKRLSAVDRNIIRLALYEIFYRHEIPPAVSVNEAVELAKVFGNDQSGSFVNGILGRVVEDPEKYNNRGCSKSPREIPSEFLR
ncbi:transcription antitermination factor NusB [Peptococcaceae bacterium]|nr:transcription antitermination factor NusB [Peptococcaceae bacterium]